MRETLNVSTNTYPILELVVTINITDVCNVIEYIKKQNSIRTIMKKHNVDYINAQYVLDCMIFNSNQNTNVS
jgi:hypothetical protein